MIKKNKEKKICFICSSGGHFSELKKMSLIAEKYDSFLVTEKTKNFNTNFVKKIYFVKEINRKEVFFVFSFFWLVVKEIFIFLKEKPNYIITTGALIAYPIARFAKMIGTKIVYIESFARVYDLSLTGKKFYKFSDIFFVQWKDLAIKYPKAIFVGNLFEVDIK